VSRPTIRLRRGSAQPAWSAAPAPEPHAGISTQYQLPVKTSGLVQSIDWIGPGQKPSWVGFVGTIMTMAPAQADAGQNFTGVTLRANVSDGYASAVSPAFNMLVQGDSQAPDPTSWSATPSPQIQATVSGSYALPLTIPSGVSVVVTWQSPGSIPSWLSFSGSVMYWTAAAPALTTINSIVLRATPNNGASPVDCTPFNVTVAEEPALPPSDGVYPQFRTQDYPSTDEQVQALYLARNGVSYAANYIWMLFDSPNGDWWSSRLHAPWRRLTTNRRGNWIDANGTLEGTTAFHQLSFPGSGANGTRRSMSVTTLVTKQITSGENKGFYIRRWGGNFTWTTLHGRAAADPLQRPTLSVTTTDGTFSCPCTCTTWWQFSNFRDGRFLVELREDWTQAIFQFDYAAVTGTVTSATFEFSVGTTDAAQTCDIRIFEADPPRFHLAGTGVPVQGLAKDYIYDKTIDTHPDVLWARDFSGTGTDWYKQGQGLLHNNTISEDGGLYTNWENIYEPETDSWKLKSWYSAGGDFAGIKEITPKASYQNIRASDRLRTAPSEDEMYARYYMKLDENWGGQQEPAKWLGHGFRWGEHTGTLSAGGWWLAITGNSGAKGEGAVVAVNSNTGNVRYHGNSNRGHIGFRGLHPGSVYEKLVRVSSYSYHIDQALTYGDESPWGFSHTWGAGRNIEQVPHVTTVVPLETWVCIEQRIKMNTVSGSPDSWANYPTANLDGIFEVWVDGVKVFKRTMRWTRNPNYGVDNFWAETYHGGVAKVKKRSDWECNHIVLSRSYIGQRGSSALPPWRPSASNQAVELTPTNSLGTVIGVPTDGDNWYEIFDFSGGVFNPYFGAWGGLMLNGGGHTSHSDNSVFILDLNGAAPTWKRLTQKPVYWQRSDSALFGYQDGEYTNNGTTTFQPAAAHVYDCLAVIGPQEGGAVNGTFIRPCGLELTWKGDSASSRAHRLDLTNTIGSNFTFTRASTNRCPGAEWSSSFFGSNGNYLGGGGGMSAWDSSRKRLYWITNMSVLPNFIRYLDLDPASGTFQQQVKTSDFTPGFPTATHMGTDVGMMRFDPVNNILVRVGRTSGTNAWVIETYNPAQHSAGWRKAQNVTGAIPSGWGGESYPFDFCPANGKWYILGRGSAANVFEMTMPSDPVNGTWTLTQYAVGGAAMSSDYVVGKRWSWNPGAQCFIYMTGDQATGGSAARFKVFAYRPPGV
jgi:hypothetical protein